MARTSGTSRPFKYKTVLEPKAPGWNLIIPPESRTLSPHDDGIESSIRAIGVRFPRNLPQRIKDRMRAPFTELVDFGTMIGRLGYVYFMHDVDGGLVKIGFTRDLPRRLRTVKSASGRDLDMLGWFIGTTTDECRMHDRFDRLRERGEWFRATPALMRGIADILASPQTPTVSIERKYRRPASPSGEGAEP